MPKKEFRTHKKGLEVLRAEDLMQTDPHTYHQNISCHDIAVALIGGKSGAITIVSDEGKPVGIVTEYDLLRAIHEGKNLKGITPAEIMTEPVVVSEKTPIREILDTLVTGHLIHLPVVDHEDKLVGLIERHDVLAAYLQKK